MSFIEIDGLVQTLPHGRIAEVLPIVATRWHLRLPRRALRVSLLLMVQLLLLLQEVPLPHFHLLLLQVLQVHVLFLLGELGPDALLLLLGLRSRIGAILLRDRLLLLVLHCHLLHLLLHYEVLLLLLQEHELLVLGHAFQLARGDLGVHHELFVPVLEGVALKDLLLLGREAVHHFALVVHEDDVGVGGAACVVSVEHVLVVLRVHV